MGKTLSGKPTHSYRLHRQCLQILEGEDEGDDDYHEDGHQKLEQTANLEIVTKRVAAGCHDESIRRSGEWGRKT